MIHFSTNFRIKLTHFIEIINSYERFGIEDFERPVNMFILSGHFLGIDFSCKEKVSSE